MSDPLQGFQWDARKSQANSAKHGIDFDDATEVFYGLHVVRRSKYKAEERWIAIGEMNDRLIAVIYTWRDQKIRIISARRARANEERAYRDETVGRPPQR
jgi:uncharacterized DUF497 family protein